MFNKTVTVLGAALALLSCNPGATDGYWFEKKEFTAKTVQLTIVEYPNRDEINAAYKNIAKKEYKSEGKELAAFASFKYDKGSSTCTMHIIDPNVRYEPEFIGHELMHCVHGNFHASQDRQ